LNIKKLLVLGAVNPGAIEHLYIAGFKNQGISVEHFDIYDRYIRSICQSVFHKALNKISPAVFFKAINRDLLRTIQGKRYDAILVFKGMELFAETVKALKQHTPRLGNFNGDHPFTYFFPGSGNQNVLEALPFYNVHFSYAATLVERIRNEYRLPAFRIPFGYNSNLPANPDADCSRFSNSFAFIGAYDQQRGAYLDELKHPLLKIYGDEKWKTRNLHRPFIQSAYADASLFGADYRDGIHCSTGVINILREQNMVEDSHNMRTFEVPGFGGLLITQRTGEQQAFFEEDREAVFFDTVDELRSKLDFLAKNPAKIAKMKIEGHKRCVDSGYSYEHRSRELIRFFETLN
jgi:spore maturation protein CgeB